MTKHARINNNFDDWLGTDPIDTTSSCFGTTSTDESDAKKSSLAGIRVRVEYHRVHELGVHLCNLVTHICYIAGGSRSLTSVLGKEEDLVVA